MSTRRFLIAIAALLGALVLPASPAWAHNSLAEAVPARDASLTTSPGVVTLRFLQRLNPDFTTISVTDASRQRVPSSAPAVDGATGSVRLTSPLVNGTYTVAYRVVSKDGHTVQGSYRFTVAAPAAAQSASPAATTGKPAASSAAPAAAASSAPVIAEKAAEPTAARSTDSGIGTTGAVLLAIGVLIIAAGLGFLLLRKRSGH